MKSNQAQRSGGVSGRRRLRGSRYTRLADRTLVLDVRRVVEDGTHERQLSDRGLYHRMFTAQAAWYRRSNDPDV